MLAAADIGSNSVHLLVAESTGTGLRRLCNESEWLQLGEVVSREGHIPEASLRDLLRILKEFKLEAERCRSGCLYVFATEAVRVAANRDEALARIAKEAGIQVDVISGQREAEFSLRGSMLDTRARSPVLLVEVGGGSAQVASCWGSQIDAEQSLPLGSGKLLVASGLRYPAADGDLKRLEDTIDHHLQDLADFGEPHSVVGSGGVARGLIRALHRDGERTLQLEEIEYLCWAASRLSIDLVMARFNVKPNRAKTLVPGAMVFAKILRKFNQREMTVSEYGVREGAILEILDGSIKPCRA
ncbi:MAG: Exopolyphosphatase 1 [Fimbriimonadaceae bacterium]|nr:Exopolyphosphatase 1 [Fimbriimonadaceae bacterium]